MSKHQGWVASLSNGETIFETATVPGELSPWQALRKHCEDNDLWITQIQLQIAGKTWVGKKGADGYCFFRDAIIAGYVGGNPNEKHYAGIGSVVGDEVHCTVIDANLQSSQDVRSLASMQAHCVLKPASQQKIDNARAFLEEQEALLEKDLGPGGRFHGLVDTK